MPEQEYLARVLFIYHRLRMMGLLNVKRARA
jgi:hypothetical protein